MKQDVELIIDDILDDFTSRERRDFVYLTKDAADIYIKTNNTISGSFAEGLVNYDDEYYIKYFYNYSIVDSERNAEILNEINYKRSYPHGILIIDAKDCNPGFVRLLVYKEQTQKLLSDFSFYKNKKYFNGKIFLESVTSECMFEVNGPRIKAFGDGGYKADFIWLPIYETN